MGDSERCLPLELASAGLSPEGAHSFRSAFDTFRSKGEEWWAKAELRAADLITSIQPNPASESRRQAVVDYVTKLIQSCVNCQVVKFGSVPLKTYLPDGDVDLTVVSPNLEAKRTWIEDVHSVLQKEIDNPKSEFRVTEVQLVSAEVRIIKIYVEKLLVDVSFDQLGGVCTLCFLEEVDRVIGEDHLFKRSIILVKAWCYYESRLLGANCNLMSTYALETLVLYIFHHFHASLRGPLQVLYLFLEFFSSFDWDKYCVSLSSPILLASFSEETERQSIIADDFQRLALSPRREGGELLFTKAFLDACEQTYGLMPINQIAKPTKFAVKSLNIIDPLRSTNNLGRSVNQGNCARIRRAFVLGARTLRNILHANEADVSSELDQFFKNCNLRYHGSYQRPDVGPPRSSQGKIIPNGVQKMGGAKRSDMAKTEDVAHASVSQNGDHPAPQARLYHNSLFVDPKEPTVRDTTQEVFQGPYGGVYEGAGIPFPSAVELASGREENTNESSARSLTSVPAEEGALNFGETKIAAFNGSNGLLSHDSRHIDEGPIRGDETVSTRIPGQIQGSLQIVCDQLPFQSGAFEEDDLSSPGILFSERNGSDHRTREGLDALVAHMGGAGVSKQGTLVNGNQQSTNGSTSPCSKNDSEEDEESSSQSSSKGEPMAASENATVLGVPDSKRGNLLPLSCQPENFETSRNGSSSELQGRPPDPQDSASDVAAAQTEVQTPSYSEQLVSVRNEEEREFSVPVDAHKQTGNSPGFEYPGVAEISHSKVPRRKGKLHQQNGTFQSKELELGSGVVQPGKSKRGPGREKGHYGRAQDGGQVSSSTGTAHSPQQASVLASVYNQHMHPPRHLSTDATTGTTHFKASQSRPYPNATGPGSFRHPLANYQFDPGTARMTGGSSSASSHSSGPQYLPTYYPPPMQFPPGFLHSSMYSPDRMNNNIHKRNSPVKGDGSSGVNIAKSRPMDQDMIQGSVEPVPTENSVDSPTHKNQSKVSEQVAVGIVERLEANGIPASTSSRRSQTAAAARNNNTHGALVPSGNSSNNSEFLTGNLKLHLNLLAYGRECDYWCSPTLQFQIGYPAVYAGSEQHAHMHGSWEGPGRPAQLMGHPAFYASGHAAGWILPFQQQQGFYPQLQPFWGPRGVELSPRPRGTGTYLPNTLRQNIKVPSGRVRGVGSQQQDADKYHHQSREHENTHHFHGPHHRAPTNKDEPAHAQAVYGTAPSNRLAENRSSALKTERARDFYHPKQSEYARASHSLPTSPSVSSTRGNYVIPGELLTVPHPGSELLQLHTVTDLDSVDALDVTRKSCHDASGLVRPVGVLSGSSEGNVDSTPLSPVSEFLHSQEEKEGLALLDGGWKSGPQLKRSASVGHNSYDLVQSDDAVVISGLPTTIGEVIPTAATTSQRNGRQTYHMKEEDFPPLGGRRVNRAELATGGTNSSMANGIGRYVSL